MKLMRDNPGEGDEAASAACTKSGAFALLLSVVLCLLIPYWLERPNYQALSKYLAFRWNLANAVADLNDSPLWRKYALAHPNADATPIAQLADIKVETWGDQPNTDSVINSKPEAQKSAPGAARQIVQSKKPRPPAPPGGLSVSPLGSPTAKLPRPKKIIPPGPPVPPTAISVTMFSNLDEEAKEIAAALTSVNNPEVLTRTRRTSNFFNLSILRWFNKARLLAYQNYLAKKCTLTAFYAPYDTRHVPDTYIPALTTEALLGCLTVRDVQTLAHFELPHVSNTIEVGGRVGGGPKIDISPGALPREPYLATLVAQILLFSLLLYFGAFVSEAVKSVNFPAAGTLFSGFSQSSLTRLSFLLFLCAPAVASVAVAVSSRKWLVEILAVLVVVAEVPIFYLLQRKSYFWSGNRNVLIETPPAASSAAEK